MAPTSLLRAYLIFYNSASCLGWLYFLYVSMSHFILHAEKSSEPEGFAARLLSTAPEAASTLHSVAGGTLVILLAAAGLEVVHALMGFVRSPVGTTALQVSARLIVLLGATRISPDSARDWGFALMAASWGLVEVPRYAFYLAKLLDVVPYPLTWLRYSLFLVLYPPGILGEVRELVAALPFVRATQFASIALPNSWNVAFSYEYFLYFLLLLYIPGSPTMIGHMWRQRRKELGAPAAGKARSA